MNDVKALSEEIILGITKARERVYKVGQPTPLHEIQVAGLPVPVWVKREDLGPIKAYKWRGAYNAVSALDEKERKSGIIAASAGNHAQGVALACSYLECFAEIFMPVSTPMVKQKEVARLGGKWVSVTLHGDTYDDASLHSQEVALKQGATFIHPYNDPDVIAGQGTLADEVVMSGVGPFDRVYVAIGGGGLASAVASWLKFYWPDIQVIGVEGEGQASMKLAIEQGEPSSLDYLDVFCDGTAVRKVGRNTHALCSSLLDRVVTVSNEEVCDAVKIHWDTCRVIPEPSGAMSLAGLIKEHEGGYPLKAGEKPLTILCGANMDFAKIGKISSLANISNQEQLSLRMTITDESGSLGKLLESLPSGLTITDMQYGYAQTGEQYPILTFTVKEEEKETVLASIKEHVQGVEEVHDDTLSLYRMIEFSRELLADPAFYEVEFPERAGALKEFMEHLSPFVNLFYFNYQYSGERVGRALVGMDFTGAAKHDEVVALIEGLVPSVVRCVEKVAAPSCR